MGQVSAATGVLNLLLGILSAEYFRCILVFLITVNGCIQGNSLHLLQTITISRNQRPSERSISDQAFNQPTNQPIDWTAKLTTDRTTNKSINQQPTERDTDVATDPQNGLPDDQSTNDQSTNNQSTNNQSTKQAGNQAVM